MVTTTNNLYIVGSGASVFSLSPPGGHSMRTILRQDESGVSEVVGPVLILAMTVVLFSVIIVWVTNIPTPSAQARTDIQSEMNPIYNALGVEIGVNITLTHQGGEALFPVPTIIYVIAQRGSNNPQTDVCLVHTYNKVIGNGLLDGTDSVWDIGERWNYKSLPGFYCSLASFGPLLSSDQITIIIVDHLKSIVLWTGPMNAPVGTRPPVFVDKWTDGILATEEIDPVQATQGFYIFAKVTDPDNDLNVNSVYVTITAWYGSGTSCAAPQPMNDNGVSPDRIAGDKIFSFGANACTKPLFPALSWAGSIILLNATDLRSHVQDETGRRLVAFQVSRIQQNDGSGPAEGGKWRFRAGVRSEGENLVSGDAVRGDPVIIHRLGGGTRSARPIPCGDRHVNRIHIQVVVRVRDFREDVESLGRLDRVDLFSSQDSVGPLVDEYRGTRAGRRVHGAGPQDDALQVIDDNDRDLVRGPETGCTRALVRPALADVPDAVRPIQEAARSRQEAIELVQDDDIRLRRVRAALRRHVDDRRHGLHRLAALVSERDIHADLYAERVIDRVHHGLDVGPGLRRGRWDGRHPDDDDGEQHDGHREDQDRADDFRHTRLVFAEDGSHEMASRWAQGHTLAPDPTIYK